MAYDLDERARRVIDANDYLTVATVDDASVPRVTPVYCSHHDYRTFYWGSAPTAHHSSNIARNPLTHAVVFDSTVPVGQGQAVWITGRATEVVGDADVRVALDHFVVELPDHPGLTAGDVTGDAPLRLYALVADEIRIHVHGDDPDFGTGADAQVLVTP